MSPPHCASKAAPKATHNLTKPMAESRVEISKLVDSDVKPRSTITSKNAVTAGKSVTIGFIDPPKVVTWPKSAYCECKAATATYKTTASNKQYCGACVGKCTSRIINFQDKVCVECKSITPNFYVNINTFYCSNCYLLLEAMSGGDRMCESQHCKAVAEYNYINTPPLYCRAHRYKGMVNTKSNICHTQRCHNLTYRNKTQWNSYCGWCIVKTNADANKEAKKRKTSEARPTAQSTPRSAQKPAKKQKTSPTIPAIANAATIAANAATIAANAAVSSEAELAAELAVTPILAATPTPKPTAAKKYTIASCNHASCKTSSRANTTSTHPTAPPTVVATEKIPHVSYIRDILPARHPTMAKTIMDKYKGEMRKVVPLPTMKTSLPAEIATNNRLHDTAYNRTVKQFTDGCIMRVEAQQLYMSIVMDKCLFRCAENNYNICCEYCRSTIVGDLEQLYPDIEFDHKKFKDYPFAINETPCTFIHEYKWPHRSQSTSEPSELGEFSASSEIELFNYENPQQPPVAPHSPATSLFIDDIIDETLASNVQPQGDYGSVDCTQEDQLFPIW